MAIKVRVIREAKNCGCGQDPCITYGAQNESKKEKENFKPHMMYDPKTGKGIKAKTYEKHVELDEKGWSHEKPGDENYPETLDIDEAKNKDGKERGGDGKACWKGRRYAGTEDGKDKCVPMEENYIYITEASLDDGTIVEDMEFWDDVLEEAEYQGRKVTLNKPTRGDVKKFKVFVKDPKTGNVKKVNFGDPNMRIRKSNPKARKSFRARHKCKTPGPKTKPRYWSCKKW